MNDAIKHRGPDAVGVFFDQGVALGHRRLAVIDLSPAGVQPMGYRKQDGASSETFHPERFVRADFILVFNGEIYNYRALREELIREGCTFSTESDSEVILAAYSVWGFSCVTHMNGMWAFCIYDKKKQILFASRDRLGVKPFYYTATDAGFRFSSELKGLVASEIDKTLDKEALGLYFSLGFIPAPFTIYSSVRKLEAAHNIQYEIASQTYSIERYWELPRYSPKGSRAELVAEGKELLADAVRLRVHADVPVGAFLSGGLDSSAVVGEMRKYTKSENLHTFSIGFDGRHDESPYINIVSGAFKTKHHHSYFGREDFEEHLEDFATMYDEPFGDFSGFPTRLVSKEAREFVTVALSGDGGDEVFGGYPAHVAGYRLDLIKRLPRFLRKIIASLQFPESSSRASLRALTVACRLTLGNPDNFLAEARIGDGIRTLETKRWLKDRFAYALDRGQGSYAEALRIHDALSNTLPDTFLVKVDRASMHHALEVRSPFLDYRFYEYAQRVPSKWKAGLFRTKIIMRDIIEGSVPEAIVHRNKQGFNPPIADWILDEAYRPRLEAAVALLEDMLPDIAGWYRDRITLDTEVNRNYLVRLFLFQIWYERWIGSPEV